MAAIQNIKIQHKRYSSAQWQNGITINGQTVTPMLAHGEIGLATDTLEVRIGTLSGGEQTWSQARPIDSDVILEKKYKNADITDTTGKMVVDALFERDTASGKHKLTLIYADIPATTVQLDEHASAPTADKITVVTGLENSDHAITYDTAEAATVAYVNKIDSALTKKVDDLEDVVDTKLDALSATDDDVIILTTSKDGTTGVVDGKHKKYNGINTAQTAVQAGAGDSVTIPVQAVTYDIYGHVSGSTTQDITIDIPDFTDIPDKEFGDNSATSTKIINSVSMTDGVLDASTKDIVKKTGSKITVEGTSTEIQVGVDLSDYVTKNELSEAVNGAMDFAGTVSVVGDQVTDLSSLSDKTNGAVYLVTVSGTGTYQVKDTVDGIHVPGDHTTANKSSITVKSGDMFIYHVMANGNKHWEYVPSADDYDDTHRLIAAEGTLIYTDIRDAKALDISASNDAISITTKSITLDNGDSAESIQIGHTDTSNVEDLSKANRTYVDSLTFDEYGHVTGYTVGTESVIDTNTAHAHTAGAKLEIVGGGGIDGNVEYAHTTIATTTNKDASKKATVTAGSGATFTVVDSLENDGYGHITNVVTKDVQIDVPADTNTLYDVKGESITDGAQVTLTPSDALDTASNVQFTGEDGTTVSFKNGKIVISSHDTTYELATEALAGLVKVANVLSEASSVNATTLKNYTGNNPDKLYGVNRRADGTTFVEVPWHDTTYTASNGVKLVENDIQHEVTGTANASVDMYAFGTDAYGHTTGLVSITTIDGNYA